jgi:hypothetical protein
MREAFAKRTFLLPRRCNPGALREQTEQCSLGAAPLFLGGVWHEAKAELLTAAAAR